MTALTPWPDAPNAESNRTIRRLRLALSARGYDTPETFRRELNPPQEWCYDPDEEYDPATDTQPVLWAWTIPYCPLGRPDDINTLHAGSMWDALHHISFLPEVTT